MRADEPMIVLTEEQRELVSALDSLGLGFAYTDGARVLFASQTYAEMVEFTVEQVLTMSDPFVMIAPDDRDRARAYTIEWMSGRPIAPSLEVSLETASGRQKRVMLAVQRVAAEGGRSHVLVIVVDLEAAATTGATQLDLRRLARAIADGSHEPFMLLRDAKPHVLMLNRAALELARRAGWSRDSAPSPREVLESAGVRDPAGVLDEAGRDHRAAQRTGTVGHVRYEITIVRMEGTCVLWWREAGGARSHAPHDLP